MTVPTKTVTIDVLEPNGTALSGAVVTARLTGYDVYLDQIIERYTATTTTNGAGRATLALFPNTLGERESAYVFTIRHPTTNRKIYQTVARLPNEDVNLTDIAGNIETVTVETPETVAIGVVVRLENGTYGTRMLVANGAGLAVTNGDGADGNLVVALADDLAAIEALATSGLAKRTGTATWAIVTLDAFSEAALALTSIAAWQAYLTLVPGTNVQAWDADLDALAANTGTGIIVRSGSGTVAVRTLTAPAAGITVTNGSGVSGNPTLVLANDLGALEALGSTGFAVRTATDTWSQRTITAGTGIGVTNGDGVSGNPAIAITDVELLAIAGLTSAADRGVYFTGSGTAALFTLTAAGRSLVAGADAPAQLVTLGAVAKAGDTMTGTLTLFGEPTGALQAVPLRDIAGYLHGLTLSNNVGDVTNDIDIAVGVAVSKEDGGAQYGMLLATAMGKRLDAAWAVGGTPGATLGMLATGAAVANGTYHIFEIARPDTGVVDVAADTSATGANITANTNAAYTKWRRIGSIIRAAGAILRFVQTGDDILATGGGTQDVNLTNPTTNAVTCTFTGIPTGIVVDGKFSIVLDSPLTAGLSVYLSALSTDDVAPSATNTTLGFANLPVNAQVHGTAVVRTNTARQIRLRASASGGGEIVRINSYGWVDRRGREA